MNEIAGVALVPLNLVMKQPFVTAHGEKRTSRNLLVAVRLSNGITGYGEGSASLAWPQETQEAMTGILRPLIPKLIGCRIGALRRLAALVWESAGRFPAAASALECALADAYTRQVGISLWKWLGGARRCVTTGLTLSAWKPAMAADFARRARATGFRRFKIKVTGRDLDQDIRRVFAVHRAAPRTALWIDANQGFTAQEAVRFALFLRQQKIPIRLIEQPVARQDREGLALVEREGGVPVAADESARSVEEALTLIRHRTVSVLNLKLAKTGLLGSLRVMRRAKAAGIRLMVGCMAESAIGLSHSVAMACGTGAFEFVDLDSHLLVVSPRCRAGFSARPARLSVYPTRPGSGVAYPLPQVVG